MKKRLLIVDDSPVMRSFIRRIIELSSFGGCECREASNGEEALALLERDCADLVITDINMPGMDGERLIQALKADSRFAALPVIVVSTDSTDHRMQRLMALGASGYLRKPFVPEKLNEVLSGFTEGPGDES